MRLQPSDFKRIKEHRVHRVTNSYGLSDAYKYYKDNKGNFSKATFSKVIKLINDEIKVRLSNGEDIILPFRMGSLELRKFITGAKFKDGKLITNYPIDWKSTLELWSADEESAKKKILVRFETPQVYRFIYKKSHAMYDNKSYYSFLFNRDLKKLLKENINNNKIDAFILARYGTKIY